ncbi:MAG: hypothetical protein AB9861_19575 [Methanosarcina sp.]|jgi:hypothetical protein
MKEIKSTKEVKAEKKEQSPGRWMPAGIGVGATLGILFGSFVLGPATGSQVTGLVLGMSMGAGAGLVMGLSLGSKGSSEFVSKKKKRS